MADCFGISALGLCSYDPGNPANIYFSVGEAIAALSISLAIPQFLKPIYRFRLAAQSVHAIHLYSSVFAGAIFVLAAALLPHIPMERRWLIAYPVFWEICGGLLFVGAFALLVLSVLRPARAVPGSYPRFGRAAADFLAHATERDQADFADDLYRNINDLVKTAAFGRFYDELSAFFLFRYRRQIDDASYARALLTLVAEPKFCEVLVHRCPWTTAQIVRCIASAKVHTDDAEVLIQEVARQAIISPSSMMAREVGFKGFVAAPVLSSSLFENSYLNRHYQPLCGLEYGDFRDIDRGFVARLNHAYRANLRTVLESGDFRFDRSLRQLADHFQSAAHEAHRQVRADRNSYSVALEVFWGLRQLVQDTTNCLAGLDDTTYESLYVQTKEGRDFSVLDYISEAVINVLFSFANDFSGHDDSYWTIAIGIIDEQFGWAGNQAEGMDPLQQRVAIKLVEKVKDNMNGWYPAITRVLLPVLDRRPDPNEENPKSARSILLQAFYAELKRFPELYDRDAEKALDHIAPESVRYDAANQSIIQIYRSGEGKPLSLREIRFDAPSLDPDTVRRVRVG